MKNTLTKVIVGVCFITPAYLSGSTQGFESTHWGIENVHESVLNCHLVHWVYKEKLIVNIMSWNDLDDCQNI